MSMPSLPLTVTTQALPFYYPERYEVHQQDALTGYWKCVDAECVDIDIRSVESVWPFGTQVVTDNYHEAICKARSALMRRVRNKHDGSYEGLRILEVRRCQDDRHNTMRTVVWDAGKWLDEPPGA